MAKEIDAEGFRRELMAFIKSRMGDTPVLVAYAFVSSPGIPERNVPIAISGGHIANLPAEPHSMHTVMLWLLNEVLASLNNLINVKMGGEPINKDMV